MKNHASLVALLGIVFVILSGNAVVEGQSRRQMLIHRVAVDFVSDEILVFGVNFTAGKDDPSATLGGQPVDVLGFEDTAVTLRLPPATAPGDYFLTISTGSGSVKNDAFDFTIGAVGPQGDVGTRGPIGPQGPEGQPGPTPSFFGQSCPDGESVIGFDETGNLICNLVPPPPSSSVIDSDGVILGTTSEAQLPAIVKRMVPGPSGDVEIDFYVTPSDVWGREVDNENDSFPSTMMRWTVWFEANDCSGAPNLTGIADSNGLGNDLGQFDVSNLPNNEGVYAVGTYGGGLFYMVPETTVRDSSFEARSRIDFLVPGDCIQLSRTDNGSSLEVVFPWGVLTPPFSVVP